DLARELKGARFALWKNPENLTRRQEDKITSIRYLNEPLFRAYLLKEQLRLVFKKAGTLGKEILGEWLQWARRWRIRPFAQLARTITRHRVDIETTLDLGLLCPRRVDQHEDPAPHPYLLRLSLSRRPHQLDHARSRRTLPVSPGPPRMTHGNGQETQ